MRQTLAQEAKQREAQRKAEHQRQITERAEFEQKLKESRSSV